MASVNPRFSGFTGIPEAQKVFEALGKRLGDKVVAKVLRDNAAAYIRRAKELSSNADVTGDTTKSIGIIILRSRARAPGLVAGPRRGNGYKGHTAHLLEFGTAPRQNATGANRGQVTAQPFLRPAFDETHDAMLAGIKLDLTRLLTTGFASVQF